MFSYNTKVRYSEVDCNRKLTIPAIINYLQDTCVLHSESVGAGLDYVESSKRVWMLGAWRIEFIDDIYFMDDITVKTWPYKFKSFMGYRNLIIEKNSNICVRADSTWMLYSISDKKLARVSEEDERMYPCERPMQMEKCKRKLTLPDCFVKKNDITVTESFIDTNGHVNNGKYVEIAIDVSGIDLTCTKVSVLEAEYKKQARLKDIIIPFVFSGENEVFVSLRDEDGSIFANIKFDLS